MTQLKCTTESESRIAKDDTCSTPISTKKGWHHADASPVYSTLDICVQVQSDLLGEIRVRLHAQLCLI